MSYFFCLLLLFAPFVGLNVKVYFVPLYNNSTDVFSVAVSQLHKCMYSSISLVVFLLQFLKCISVLYHSLVVCFCCAVFRCFTFGIGSGASSHLVEGLARAGNGTAEFVKEGERMQPKVYMRSIIIGRQ